MRALLVALLLSAVVVAPARAAEIPALGKTTKVNGGSPTSMLVELRQPLSLDFERKLAPPIPALDAGGTGLAVVDLRRVGAATGFGKQISIQFYFSAGRALGWMATTNGANKMALPAGRYRLYVSSTDPVRATLTLPTLAGEAQLSPAEPEPAQIRELDASPVAPPGVVAFGGDGDLTADGDLLVVGHVAAREQEVAERVGICRFTGGTPPIGAAAYHPGCPGGGEVGAIYPLGGPYLFFLGLFPGVPLDRYGLGWNFSHPGETLEARGFALWQPIRDDGKQPGLTPDAPPAPPPAARGTVSIPAKVLRVRRGRVRVPLRCSGDGPCSGSVAIGRRSARFTLPAQHSGHVSLRAPRRRRAAIVLTAETSTGVVQSRRVVRLRRR